MTAYKIIHQYPKTITEAATILDVAVPRWEQKVNTARLDMDDMDDCILGQLFGPKRASTCRTSGFYKGMGKLFDFGDTQIERKDLDRVFGGNASKKKWVEEIEARRTLIEIPVSSGEIVTSRAGPVTTEPDLNNLMEKIKMTVLAGYEIHANKNGISITKVIKNV